MPQMGRILAWPFLGNNKTIKTTAKQCADKWRYLEASGLLPGRIHPHYMHYQPCNSMHKKWAERGPPASCHQARRLSGRAAPLRAASFPPPPPRAAAGPRRAPRSHSTPPRPSARATA
eukprot:360340-Chlamydomonas_euryale.AAC.1